MPWVTLHRSGHEGYGDYVHQRDNRYHFSGGIDARQPGQFGLGPPSFRAALSGHKDTPTGAVVWADANGLAFFAAVGNKLIRYGHTATIEDLSGTSAAQSIALHDNGSGVPYLYITYGDGNFIDRRNSAGTIQQAAVIKAFQLESMDDGRLVRVDTNQYQIRILPAGADAFVSASWPTAGINVGLPHHKITALAHIGNIIIVAKEDGGYAFNPVDATFVNLTPSIAPHPDNGKGMRSVGGLGVLMPLANGDVILIDQGLRARSVGPANGALSGRDTPMARITALGHAGEWGYAYQEPFAGKTRGAGVADQGLGTYAMIDDDGTFTKYAATVIDNNPDTVVEFTGLGGAGSADYFYVGALHPFEGCYVTVETANTTATSGFDTAEYYNGSAWTSLTMTDLTYRSIPDCSLARTGYLGWSDRNIPSSMAKTTVNSLSRYWVRFHLATAAAVA